MHQRTTACFIHMIQMIRSLRRRCRPDRAGPGTHRRRKAPPSRRWTTTCRLSRSSKQRGSDDGRPIDGDTSTEKATSCVRDGGRARGVQQCQYVEDEEGDPDRSMIIGQSGVDRWRPAWARRPRSPRRGCSATAIMDGLAR